jgi:succinate dehydrogenase / fumarate reductase cytochrome b subunit
VLEVLGIGLPILFHIVLGILLGNTEPGMLGRHAYPRDWMFSVQRVTGGYLVLYVVFHVWGTRLSTEVLKGGSDLFELMRKQLENPTVFAGYVLAVLAACSHFGIGLIGLAAHWDFAPRARRRLTRLGMAVFLVLSVVGLNAVLAFVSRPARWLEPAGAAAGAPGRAAGRTDPRGPGSWAPAAMPAAPPRADTP